MRPLFYSVFFIFFIFQSYSAFANNSSFSLDEIISFVSKGTDNPKEELEKIYQAKDFYFQILSYQEELNVVHEVRKHFEKAVSKAEENFDKGEDNVSQSSITKLKLGLFGTLNDIAGLESAIAQSRISLAQLVNRGERTNLKDDRILPGSFPFKSFDDYFNSLRESNEKSALTNSGRLQGDLHKAFLRIDEAKKKMKLAQKSKKITRALLVIEAANYDFGIGDAGDLFEALIIYTRVLRGYFQSIYKLNIAIADIEKIQP